MRSLYNPSLDNMNGARRFSAGAVECDEFGLGYFVQKVARPWHVTMPPSGLQRYRLFMTR